MKINWISILALAGSLALAQEAEFLNPAEYVGLPKPLHAENNRAFQGIPSLAVTLGGRLWAAWYAGISPGEDCNNYVVLSSSTDAGKSWNEVLVVDPDEGGPVRVFDPELWMSPDGNLYLFWAQSVEHDGTVAGVWAMKIMGPDDVAPLYGTPARWADGVMMCKPMTLSTGEWVLPASTWRKTDHSAKMVVSTDQGKTWSVRGGCNVPEEVRTYDEHMLIERKDGSLWMLVRTAYGIGESISTDRGETWPELAPSVIAHTDSRFFIQRLQSGNLLLIKHGQIGERTDRRSHLRAFISIDDGKTWNGGLLLDERDGVSYPDGQQDAFGRIRIVYDYSRTGDRQILMASFREEDAAAGTACSSDVQFRQLVSGAPSIVQPVSGHQEKLVKFDLGRLALNDTEALPFKHGERLFSDRDYKLLTPPDVLHGAHFLPVQIVGIKTLTCTRGGTIFIVTPSLGRNKDSQEQVLLEQGFVRTDVPEFALWNRSVSENFCTLYQKNCAEGEIIKFGKWAVPVFFP